MESSVGHTLGPQVLEANVALGFSLVLGAQGDLLGVLGEEEDWLCSWTAAPAKEDTTVTNAVQSPCIELLD